MYREYHETDILRHVATHEVAALFDVYRRHAPHDGPVALEPFRREIEERFGPFTTIARRGESEPFQFVSQGRGAAVVASLPIGDKGYAALPPAIATILDEAYSPVLERGKPLLALHRPAVAQSVHVWERLVLPAVSGSGVPHVIDFAMPREFRAELLSSVLEASCSGILSLKAISFADGAIDDAVVITVNRQAAQYLGAPSATLIDQPVRATLERLGGWERWRSAFEKGASDRFEVSCVVEKLDTLLRVTVTPLADGIAVSLNDITDLRYALIEMEVSKEEAERARLELVTEISARRMIEGELRRIATTDGLTGVLNRRGFEDRMQKEAATARRYGYPLSVVAIDIDHFKRVNDMHGHAAGDMVLMSVAALFMEEIRQDSDTVGRVGGEEFMAILPHTPAEGAVMVAERLRQRLLSLPILVGETSIKVTASFGVSEFVSDAEATVIRADEALYQAKNAGRDRVVLYKAPDVEALQGVAGIGGRH